MKKSAIILLLQFLIIAFSYAQHTISGNVIDGDFNEPLLGATVQIKGTSQGTATDFEGNFQLTVAPGKYILLFSYMGLESKEVEVDATDGSVLLDPITLVVGAVENQTIIVTDGKYAKKLEESTVSIDVINAKMLESQNATSLDQVVQKTSGVKIMDNQVSIRAGAGYAYGVGSRVSFLVDGQPLLSAELSDVKWNFMPIENAEQVEVIKGSASVLYGSGALNGVINMRTAYPKGNEPYTSFSLYAGAYDQPPVDSMRWFNPKDMPAERPMFMGLYFAHRQRINKNFDLVLGGNFHLENGFIQSVDERRFRFNFNTRYRHPGTDGRISYGINGNMMYHRQGTFFLAQNMMEGAYKNISLITGDRYGSITIDPYLTAFDKTGNKHDLRARWFNIARHQAGPDSDAHIFSLEYQFQREFKHKWILTAGVFGQHFNVNSILFADPAASTGSDRALFTGQSIAAYAQIDKKIIDRISMTLGVRWEGYFLDTNFIATPPIFRAGFNFELSQHDFIRLSFGQGFRVPSFGELYINEPLPLSGPIQMGVYPNANLKPETGWTAELAYRRNFQFGTFKFYTDLAFFWMEYRNMIEFALGSYPQGFGFRFNNVNQARIAGFELSAQSEGKIGQIPLRIWGGYTYSFPGDMTADTTLRDAGIYLERLFTTFAKKVNRDPRAGELQGILKYRSLHSFRMDIETEYKNFIVGFAANYNSFIMNIDAIFTFGFVTPGVQQFRSIHNKGAWVLDFRIGYRINNKQRLNFVVSNFLNEEYAIRPARMGTPRTFSLKYSHTF